jgi:uncharacterized membrane protein
MPGFFYMHEHTERIVFLDFMRGFAVAVMVMGHTIDSVLSLELRTTELFRLYDAARGFTAPLFLFISGYAFSVATEKRWADFLSPGRTTLKRVGKLVSLLAIGYGLHFPFMSFNKILTGTKPEEYAQLFQVDVLHCVAVSMLILHALILVARTPRAFVWAVLGMAIAIVLSAPLLWSVDLAPLVSRVIAPYLNQHQPSIFPLVPYAAFLFVGVVAGHFFLEARRLGRDQQFFRWMLAASIAACAGGIVFDVAPVALYPPHDYWKTSPNFFLIRLSVVLLVTVGFSFARRIPDMIGNQLVKLGQASLFIYIVHLVVVYGSSANDGLMQVIGQRLASVDAVLVGLCVLCGMIIITHVREYLRANHDAPLRFAQIALAGTLLFNFFTNPW